MGSFKMLKDKEYKDNIFVGYYRDDEYIELIVEGHKLIILKSEVELVEILN